MEPPAELMTGSSKGQRAIMRAWFCTRGDIGVDGCAGSGKSTIIKRLLRYSARNKHAAVLAVQPIRKNMMEEEIGADACIISRTVQKLIYTKKGSTFQPRLAASRVPISAIGKRTDLIVWCDEYFCLNAQSADSLSEAVAAIVKKSECIKRVRWIFSGDPKQLQSPSVESGEASHVLESMHCQIGTRIGLKSRSPIKWLCLTENMRISASGKNKRYAAILDKMRTPQKGRPHNRDVDRFMMTMTLKTLQYYPDSYNGKIRDPMNTTVIAAEHATCVHWNFMAAQTASKQGYATIRIVPCAALRRGSGKSSHFKATPKKLIPEDTLKKSYVDVWCNGPVRFTQNIYDENGTPIVDNGDVGTLLTLPLAARPISGQVAPLKLSDVNDMAATVMTVRHHKTQKNITIRPVARSFDGAIHFFQFAIGTIAMTVQGVQGVTLEDVNPLTGQQALYILDCKKMKSREMMYVAMSRPNDLILNRDAFHIFNYPESPWKNLRSAFVPPSCVPFMKSIAAAEVRAKEMTTRPKRDGEKKRKRDEAAGTAHSPCKKQVTTNPGNPESTNPSTNSNMSSLFPHLQDSGSRSGSDSGAGSTTHLQIIDLD